ncbi:MAG: AraC family transcriptional regulator [Oscillospiraceae bacterium]
MRKENIWFQDFQVLLNEAPGEQCMALEHWHDCWEMLYMEKGGTTQICDTGISRFTAGDILLIAPKTVHSTFSDQGGSRIIVIQFDESLWPGVAEYSYPAAENPYLPEMTRLFFQLLEEYQGRRDGFLNMTHGALLQIFAYLTRLKKIPVARSKGYFKTRYIFQYIDAHIRENITLEETAKALGYSPQYLTSMIKEYSGYSFKPYVDYAKIMAAVRMLRFDDKTVSDVAESLAYTDVSAFSRAFKRVTGSTPSAFRS